MVWFDAKLIIIAFFIIERKNEMNVENIDVLICDYI